MSWNDAIGNNFSLLPENICYLIGNVKSKWEKEMRDITIVGHLVEDIIGGERRIGGSTAYAASTARRLGADPGILTSKPRKFSFWQYYEGIPVWGKETDGPTIFELFYDDDGKRSIYLRERSDTISTDDVPEEAFDVKAAFICPIMNEIPMTLFREFVSRGIRTVVTPQGFLRRPDDSGLVRPFLAKNIGEIAEAGAIIMSDQDHPDVIELVEMWRKTCPVIIVTHGKRGATVFNEGKSIFVPALPANEVDATGAGDVFATAFTLSWMKGRGVLESAGFASAAAAFCVEGPGCSALTDEENVLARLKSFKPVKS